MSDLMNDATHILRAQISALEQANDPDTFLERQEQSVHTLLDLEGTLSGACNEAIEAIADPNIAHALALLTTRVSVVMATLVVSALPQLLAKPEVAAALNDLESEEGEDGEDDDGEDDADPPTGSDSFASGLNKLIQQPK